MVLSWLLTPMLGMFGAIIGLLPDAPSGTAFGGYSPASFTGWLRTAGQLTPLQEVIDCLLILLAFSAAVFVYEVAQWGYREIPEIAGLRAINITHYLVSALSRKEVYHFLDTHPWAYPLGAALVVLLVGHFRHRRYRSARGESARFGSRQPDNVTVLARPTRLRERGSGYGRSSEGVTLATERLAGLDLIRGVAVILLLVDHLAATLWGVYGWGWATDIRWVLVSAIATFVHVGVGDLGTAHRDSGRAGAVRHQALRVLPWAGAAAVLAWYVTRFNEPEPLTVYLIALPALWVFRGREWLGMLLCLLVTINVAPV